MSRSDEFEALGAKIKKGGAPKYHDANAAAGKLFCRERIALLCDPDSADGKGFVEDGLYANATAPDLPADGVVTGIGRVHGRPVAIMANDSTVKAGSWGARTVEKIIRIQETAGRLRLPLFYLVDSPARASRIRSTCSRGGATPAGSSTTRCGCRARSRRSACCSARRRPAAPTSRRSATSCSWSTRTRRCTWARRAWPRW